MPLVRGTVAGRSVLDKRTIHIADMQTQAGEFPETSENARRWGFRAILCVPLMREGVAIGTIALRRREPQLFTERQVALLHLLTAGLGTRRPCRNVRSYGESWRVTGPSSVPSG